MRWLRFRRGRWRLILRVFLVVAFFVGMLFGYHVGRPGLPPEEAANQALPVFGGDIRQEGGQTLPVFGGDIRFDSAVGPLPPEFHRAREEARLRHSAARETTP